MTALPPVTQQALTHKLPEVDLTHRPKAWDRNREGAADAVPAVKPDDNPKRESIDVDAVERQLREHYADAKTRAAGDAGMSALQSHARGMGSSCLYEARGASCDA